MELNSYAQGTHGVIMVMDITKAWTMDYIRKESEKVLQMLYMDKIDIKDCRIS